MHSIISVYFHFKHIKNSLVNLSVSFGFADYMLDQLQKDGLENVHGEKAMVGTFSHFSVGLFAGLPLDILRFVIFFKK